MFAHFLLFFLTQAGAIAIAHPPCCNKHYTDTDKCNNSALQGYYLNNNANGYTMPDLSTATDGQGGQGDLYFENGIQTPGITTIPICGFDQVASNWEKHGHDKSKPDGYPCN